MRKPKHYDNTNTKAQRTPEKQQIHRQKHGEKVTPGKWQSKVEKEKRFISLTASNAWKGMLASQNTNTLTHQMSQLQPNCSEWDDSIKVN